MISLLQQSSSVSWAMPSNLFKVSSRSMRTSTLTGLRQRSQIEVSAISNPLRTGPFTKGMILHRSSQDHPVFRLHQSVSPHSHSIPARHLHTPRVTYVTTATIPTEPIIHELFEPTSGTWQYLIADPSTSTAVIIDPVLNYDPATQVVATGTADSLLSFVKNKGYKIDRILETHAHADHLTAASYLQKRLAEQQDHKPPICIGKRIEQVQTLFGERYGVPKEEYEGIFDKLFHDNETFAIGNLKATTIHLPGHTPDHLGYMIGDNLFCGDSLFHVDIGTARCDFPGGNAKDLFQSCRKLLSLPDHVKIWIGHDYPPQGRNDPVPWMSVQDHKKLNKHLKDGISEEEFVTLRNERDAGLAAPKLLHQSLQINIRAGRLPLPTHSGYRLLHLPLKLTGEEW